MQRVTAICMGLALVLGGCGHDTQRPTAPVSGLVTYQGKPLDHGRVVFIHEPSGHGAAGEIAADGRYTLNAILGPNAVMIECPCLDPKATSSVAGRPNMLMPPSLIPARYADHMRSGLKCSVQDKNTTANFNLKP